MYKDVNFQMANLMLKRLLTDAFVEAFWNFQKKTVFRTSEFFNKSCSMHAHRRIQDPVKYKCRSSHRRCSVKKGVIKILQISQEITFVGVSFLILCLKRGSNTVFSCEICEVFKNTYFEEHLLTTALTEIGLLIT